MSHGAGLPGARHGADHPQTEDGAEEVAARTVEVLRSALSGFERAGADVIHAVRLLRSILHGLATLRRLGSSRLPEPVADTITFAVAALDAGSPGGGPADHRRETREPIGGADTLTGRKWLSAA